MDSTPSHFKDTSNAIKPFIIGVSGTVLTVEEKRFIEEHTPWGFILFARNCESPEQIKTLVDDLKTQSSHSNVPILIDQEGGRVARLKPPHWSEYPPAGHFGKRVKEVGFEGASQELYNNFYAIAQDLNALGINVNCAPMLDVLFSESDEIIGDRALGGDAEVIAVLGQVVCDALIDGGVLPIIKHIPGHGRAQCDSHKELPYVNVDYFTLKHSDFVPFRALANMPMAMTAHIVYSAIDDEHCATLSDKVVRVIREEIGFSGILMTDDLSMHALSGSFAERAQRSINVGCDIVLHCNGNMDEMNEIAGVLKASTHDEQEKMHQVWAYLNKGGSSNGGLFSTCSS